MKKSTACYLDVLCVLYAAKGVDLKINPGSYIRTYRKHMLNTRNINNEYNIVFW